MNKIAIIGGGAAGLMAALTAARKGADVTVYEHNSGVGKKILASGNGRCNIINTTSTLHDYAGEEPHFIKYALDRLPFAAFEKFCLSIGLILDCKDDGRCYPLSNEAKSVVSAFKSSAENAGVKLLTDTKATFLSIQNGKFTVHCDQGKQTYDKLLIATGSEAAPQLGATDDGYRFAKTFGHEIIPRYPSLVQLHLNSKFHHKMAGVKTVAAVRLYIGGKQKANVQGDILFANYGISGLAILDISQRASHALMNHQSVAIGIDLLPRFDRQELGNMLEKLFKSVPNHSADTVLSALLPAKIVRYLLEDAAINPETPVVKLSPKDLKKLLHLIQDWHFEVIDTHGFKHAEVSGGGISTSQVNATTMESKLVKGLYFAGEVLDIVGKRGGYNFHFAWASGMIAGKEMAK